MNRISEIVEKLHQNQLLHTCNVILEKKSKISSMIINSETFEIIRHIIPQILVVKPYKIDDKYSLVVIARYQESIDIMEEINELSITKMLKETIYRDLLGTT